LTDICAKNFGRKKSHLAGRKMPTAQAVAARFWGRTGSGV
jgi:hypothetical protein